MFVDEFCEEVPKFAPRFPVSVLDLFRVSFPDFLFFLLAKFPCLIRVPLENALLAPEISRGIKAIALGMPARTSGDENYHLNSSVLVAWIGENPDPKTFPSRDFGWFSCYLPSCTRHFPKSRLNTTFRMVINRNPELWPVFHIETLWRGILARYLEFGVASFICFSIAAPTSGVWSHEGPEVLAPGSPGCRHRLFCQIGWDYPGPFLPFNEPNSWH